MITFASSPVDSFLTPFGAIFAAVGLVFLLIGVVMAVSGRRWRRHAERTEGEIVAIDAIDPDSAPGPPLTSGFVYRPTVVFTTRDGTEVRASSSIASNPKPGRVGDTVRVLYDPRNPQRVRLDSIRGRGTCLEVAFILIGGTFAVFGVAVLVLASH